MSALPNLVKLATVAVFGMVASLSANAFLLGPGDADYDGTDAPGDAVYGPDNCEPGCINYLFDKDFASGDLLFKADAPSGESGSMAGSYNWSWNGDDLSGGELTWANAGSVADCSGIGCYLAVKDGNNSPNYYFYDISSWNGMDSIELSGFWPDNGSISHVSIWGGSSVSVPEPGTVMLLMTGLIGLVASRKRLKNAL